MLVTTGFGYFIKDGLKIRKYHLPIGIHINPDDCVAVEVENKQALDSIVLDHLPEQIEMQRLSIEKIKKRKSSIEKIKKVANLTDDEVNFLIGS